MKMNHALNHHWYETNLQLITVPQAVLNHVMPRDFIVKMSVQLRDWFCILTIMKKSVWHQNFSVLTLQLALRYITSACASQVHGSYVCHNDIWVAQCVE